MAKQTFTTGQVLTAAQMTSLQQTAMGGGAPVQKTASYVLVAADAGTTIQMNSASSTTITVNTALFAAGDSVQIQNIGSGTCTITAGTATVTTAGSLALTQWEGGMLYFTSTSAAIFFDIVQGSGMTNPMTTAGDTIYGGASGTPTRLAIGSTGQVLTVSGGNPVWSTLASGSGIIKITSASFSAVSTLNIDNIFTSTYKRYMVVLSVSAASAASLELRYRVGGSTSSSGDFYGAGWGIDRTNATFNNGMVGATSAKIIPDASGTNLAILYFRNVGNSSQNPVYTLTGNGGSMQISYHNGAYWNVANTFDGINLFPSASTITGDYQVFGLAN